MNPAILRVIRDYAGEAGELAERITRFVLALEREPDADARARAHEALARGLHTLKGSAATLGLGALAELAHGLEDRVAPLAATRAQLPREVVDALLGGIDAYLAGVRAAGEGGEADVAPAADPPPAGDAPAGEGGEADGAPAAAWRVDAERVIAVLRAVERVRELRLRLDERRRAIEREADRLATAAGGAADVRVRLIALAKALRGDGEDAAEAVAALEEEVKGISTLPVRGVVEPLHRAVRDLCRSSGKEAALSIVGAELAVDRRVLEALRAPLVHLVRNAVAHGIEAPAVREARGKHREGAVVIRVEQAGNLLTLEVSDDGAGLDLERIRAVALARGVAGAAELETMAPSDLMELIFRPGFSTRDEAGEDAGRGVGLDVVRSQARALDGRVTVQSVAGQGTRFQLGVPIELGGSPVLVVRCGEHSFGVPLLAVETGVAAREEALLGGGGRADLRHRDQALRVVDLGALLRVRSPRPVTRGLPLVVVHARGRRLALAVDEVLGDQDLVIRPLPPELRGLGAYQGAATLALGELLLVLSPAWIVGEGREVSEREAAPAGPPRALVVDDSLTARAIYRTVLESGGYEVHAVTGAAQALELVGRGRYDVALVDVLLDDGDGLELARALRARADTRALPLLLISALDGPGTRQRALAAGADAFLAKKDCASVRLLSEVAAARARRQEAGPP